MITNLVGVRNAGCPLSARDTAAGWLALGVCPVPVAFGSKTALIDYTTVTVTPATLDQYFPPEQPRNVGILLGQPLKYVVDIDLDCDQARLAAPVVLPGTGWVYGRPSARASHWLYTGGAAGGNASEWDRDYGDVDGTMMCECRTKGYVVVPPSVHEGGEPIQWESASQPSSIEIPALAAAVAEVAAAALLARHWPARGSRQTAYLALAGALCRAGWEADRVRRLVRAIATATFDEERAKRELIVEGTARKIGAGEPVTGWPTMANLLTRGAEVIARVRDWLGIIDRVPAVAVSRTPAPMPWPAPPGPEAYHGVLGELVKTIEPATEADPFAVLIQALTGYGNVIGRSARFEVEADVHYTNLYTALVGETAKARKGTSFGRPIRFLAAADRDWAQVRIQSGLSSGEGLIWAVRDRIMRRERVRGAAIPPRYQEVEADPGVSDKRLFVYEPEFANVLRVSERQGSTLSPIVRTAWDTGTLSSLVKNSPARATGAHISIAAHITSDELRRLLPAVEYANGFANRFLWACVRRSKVLAEPVAVDPQALTSLTDRLTAAVRTGRQSGLVTRSPEARDLWTTIYPKLSAGRPGLAGAVLARAEAQVVRLSLLYALLDQSTTIRPEHLMAAIAVWEFCERSVLFLFGASLGLPLADARLIGGGVPALYESGMEVVPTRRVSRNGAGC